MIEQIPPSKPTVMPVRNDSKGAGHYRAPRGSRLHKGIDYETVKGSSILSPVAGKITKHGYCYGDDLKWRYVEVTADDSGQRHRLFYVEPLSPSAQPVGDSVEAGYVIGTAQAISEKWGDEMTDHIHHEILDTQGNDYDPADKENW